MLVCPRCGSERVVKNNGKQNHRCRSCGRQFVLDPYMKRIAPETWQMIDKLLLERVPLAGIARVCDISERWLQTYVNEKYAAVEQRVETEQKGAADPAVR
jgi:insertion element IS1 protein InsB